jgi:predicted ATPase
VAISLFRSWDLWLLGYPDAALVDTGSALKHAREIGQATTLMYALFHAAITRSFCGDYAGAYAETDELGSLADEKGAPFWKTTGMIIKGCVWALTGKASNGVEMIRSARDQLRSTGATLCAPWYLVVLAKGYVDIGQIEDAWR